MRVLRLIVERCLVMQRTLGSSDEFDEKTVFARFMKICEQLHVQRKDLLVCLRQEVVASTEGQALLLFDGESKPSNFTYARKVPICFDSKVYGMLLVFLNENVVQGALQDSTFVMIAWLCGFVFSTYELHWIVQEHARRSVPIPESVSVSQSDFTKQQWEVLQLICRGNTKEQIMQKLHITSSTLQKHRQAIYNILHVNSESDILMVAFQLKLFSPLNP